MAELNADGVGSFYPNVTSYAGLTLDQPRIMGVINVTPDSFSDGGDNYSFEDAVARGLSMLSAGADILDIGGESTRPGAMPISVDQECGRVLPVIEALALEGALISIDSRRSEVMAEALTAGAGIVNDVSALSEEPKSITVVAESGVPVILGHMQGQPQNMQVNPTYDIASTDIRDYLATRIGACEAAGISRTNIAVDPGIGFGKTLDHNLEILANIKVLHGFGCPVVLGASRKSFIGSLTNTDDPSKRMAGSIATALATRAHGVQIFRVHDVLETRQAFTVWESIQNARD